MPAQIKRDLTENAVIPGNYRAVVRIELDDVPFENGVEFIRYITKTVEDWEEGKVKTPKLKTTTQHLPWDDVEKEAIEKATSPPDAVRLYRAAIKKSPRSDHAISRYFETHASTQKPEPEQPAKSGVPAAPEPSPAPKPVPEKKVGRNRTYRNLPHEAKMGKPPRNLPEFQVHQKVRHNGDKNSPFFLQEGIVKELFPLNVLVDFGKLGSLIVSKLYLEKI